MVLLPGAGHMINLERATEVAAHLAGLLDAPGRELTTVIAQEEPARVDA
jgi:hypothetical protein